MLLLFQASDILIYLLNPILNFLGDSLSCIIFQVFFYTAIAFMAMIGCIHIIRRIAFERMRREVF